MDRSLKFCIKEVKRLYYLCSENKVADQLRGYREADLRLCFRICKNPVFSRRGSNERHSFHLLYVVFNYLGVYSSYSKSPITSGSPLVHSDKTKVYILGGL